MYEDYTDGILRCHSSHGTHELDPNVKKMIPDQQWAFGFVKVVDNNFWGYSSPNMNQSLVPPDINKQIESEIKKHHEKEVKHQKKKPDQKLVDEKYPSKIKKEYDPHKRRLAEVPDAEGITVQMECPHDLSTLNCGSMYTKHGHIYQVVCGAVTKPPKEHKKKTTKSQRSLTVPPNFPGSVTISPGETPYPSEETGDQYFPPGSITGPLPEQTGGVSNPEDVPPLDLTPGQDQQQQLPIRINE